jgi:NADPH-dependent glutamate synthase beta subunit-like oxidoreductase
MASTKKPGEAHEQPFYTRAQQLEKTPPCQAGCPNSGNVRGWLGYIAQREKLGLTLEEAYDKAWLELADRNPFPATIGRICPHPCEQRCTRDGKDGAVSINALERFLGDWGIERRLDLPRMTEEAREESIGVVGSGPAGLSFAYQMARRGYRVTVYEKHDVPGGMLRHAIPDYRLPRNVLDAEVDRIFEMGIELKTGIEPGKDVPLEELQKNHRVLFLGLGAQGARPLNIPGEQGPGVIPGIVYLAKRKMGIGRQVGKDVVVIGGGNTAMDAARSARRDGANVTLLYRRTEKEMPAEEQEVRDAMTEGVRFVFLAAPIGILRSESRVSGVEYQCMELGEPDDEGRRRPVPVEGATARIDADTVLVAVSQEPDWLDLGVGQEGQKWFATEQDGRLTDDIWAGGDDTGTGIASRAIAQGRLAAEAVDARLRGKPAPESIPAAPPVKTNRVKNDYYEGSQRGEKPRLPSSEWLAGNDVEIDQTMSNEQALAEAARCMSCGLCFDCHQCIMYCNARGFTSLPERSPGSYFALALEACEGCGKCIELCPCGYLDAREGSPWGLD